jgi:NAD(P)H dehydrogenase (quinone)
MTEILVLYYSRYGSTARLAEQIARGVNSVDGVSARLRSLPAVSANTEASEAAVPDNGPPYASNSDLAECAGLIMGSPTRFGNMAAPLKYFLDSTGSEWLSGALTGKPAAVFTSTSSMHGMLIVGVPYAEAALMATSTGGTPYGASHLAREQTLTAPSEHESIIAQHLGRRVAEIALKLK